MLSHSISVLLKWARKGKSDKLWRIDILLKLKLFYLFKLKLLRSKETFLEWSLLIHLLVQLGFCTQVVKSKPYFEDIVNPSVTRLHLINRDNWHFNKNNLNIRKICVWTWAFIQYPWFLWRCFGHGKDSFIRNSELNMSKNTNTQIIFVLVFLINTRHSSL